MIESKNNDCKRHDGLDFAKFLCAFAIISIHTRYSGKIYIEPLTRFAVPVFFMITGYFYASIKNRNREWEQIKKTVVLLVYSSLLYFIWNIVQCIRLDESLLDHFYSLLNMKRWIMFVFFNESLFSEHLWYLGALLYALVMILLVDKFSNRKKLYKLIPFLLASNIVLGNYSTMLFGVRLPLILTRNFLFCGLPFFLLGDALREKQHTLKRKQLSALVICSVLLTIAENVFLINQENPFNADCFIATPFLAYSLFLLFLEDRRVSETPLLRNIAQLGKRTSTAIYIIHPIVITIVGELVEFAGGYFPYVKSVYHYIAPLVILVICTALSSFYHARKQNVQ